MLVKILVGVASVLVLFVAVVATRPSYAWSGNEVGKGKMLGTDIEKGLARLKTVAEGFPAER